MNRSSLAVWEVIKVAQHSDITTYTLKKWREGHYLQTLDEVILGAASQQSLTLVTYDLKTIPNLLIAFSREKRNHSGVIFVDNKTIKPNDIGKLVKSLSILWKAEQKNDWTNRVFYLQKS